MSRETRFRENDQYEMREYDAALDSGNAPRSLGLGLYIVLAIVLAAATAILFTPLLARAEVADKAADPVDQSLPEGFGHWGVGHGRYHQLYMKMHNQKGTHCCNKGDCSPTKGRTLTDGSFEVMINGQWTPATASRRVVDAFGLDEQWHVCFDKYSKYIFCVIPENSGF